MADAAPKPKRQRKPRKSKEVDINVAVDTAPKTTSPKPQRQRRRPRNSAIRRVVKRELKSEGLEGPKVAVQQKVSSTFGFVGPNTTGNTELELNFFCHPSLAKEPNDGTAFGPLQALAAQYSLWKLKYLTLKFTPMVGASAVSGTVVRASLNLSQSPGGSNWSGLGTRTHIDMHPGKATTFHLRGSQIGGPRDGGWWFTDTNEEGSQSAGPIIEVHTLGKTNSTFQNGQWTDNLFLVEGFGVWQFANYQVKPALGSLERRVGDAEVTVVAEAGQPITMEMADTTEVAMFMDAAEPEVVAVPSTGNSVGETIFQVVDIGAEMAQKIAPPPFSWLIKGGWWFVKKILGRTKTGTSSYAVYASLSDAQNNKPAICTSSVQQAKATTKLMVTQINNPNVGPTSGGPTTLRATPITMPFGSFRVHAEMISELIVDFQKSTGQGSIHLPTTLIPGVEATKTTSGAGTKYLLTPWWIGIPGRAPTAAAHEPGADAGGYIHSVYRLINPRFTDKSGTIEYYAPPPVVGLNFCATKNYSQTASNTYAVYGQVVASNVIQAGTVPELNMVFHLVKMTTNYLGSQSSVPNATMAVPNVNGNIYFTSVPKGTGQQGFTIAERTIAENAYLLCVTYATSFETIKGVPVGTFFNFTNNTPYPRTDSPWSVVFPYNLSGMIVPATSVDLMLTYNNKPAVNQELVDQLKLLHIPFKPIEEDETEDIELEISSSSDSEDQFWDDVGAGNMPTIPNSWLNKDGIIGKLRPV